MSEVNSQVNLLDLKIIRLGIQDLIPCMELDEISLNCLWNREQWINELSNSSHICLGINISEDLLCFICSSLILDELSVTSIAVHPEWRRKGLAKMILKELIKESFISGARRIILEVSNRNVAANALYKSIGFINCGRRSNYYRDGSDAIIKEMQLFIPRSNYQYMN